RGPVAVIQGAATEEQRHHFPFVLHVGFWPKSGSDAIMARRVRSKMRLDTVRPLGRSGIRVSRIGLGCGTFGREIDDEMSFAIMDHAFELGIRLFDTAEAYGGGQSREYRRQVYGVDDEREVSGEMHSSEKVSVRWIR